MVNCIVCQGVTRIVWENRKVEWNGRRKHDERATFFIEDEFTLCTQCGQQWYTVTQSREYTRKLNIELKKIGQ